MFGKKTHKYRVIYRHQIQPNVWIIVKRMIKAKSFSDAREKVRKGHHTSNIMDINITLVK